MRRFLVPIGQSYEEDEEIPQETLGMLSMQATYLLIDKILFYYLILENEDNLKESLSDEKYNEIFDKLKKEPPAPDTINEEWAEEFWKHLEGLFNLIQKINYAPVFDPRPSPLNEITLETQPSACYELKELMDFLYGKEKLSNLFNGPLLAKIYEELIPPDLRWKWGQIYTPPEVTRLITKWAIQNPEDKVLDPACGTGRFLVSAYERLADLKGVELGEKHQEIMDQIHGIDINQFPAHLATMSLVSMNLGSFTKEVDLRVRDFFRFQAGQTNFSPKESKVELTGQTNIGKKGLEGQGKLSFGTSVGKVDAIVMNPPYSRHQALGEEYKGFVREESLSGLKDKGKIKMGRRAGFYTYFMTHGTKFLKKNGRFGMIIQNPWLDVDYGKDVQKFLLDNYKIKAIIGPQRHRFIKTADVNTVIVLLEKEPENQARKENDIKFVQLKHSIEWLEKNFGLDETLDLIERENGVIDGDLRIITKNQETLKQEGMGKTTYIGGKWGRFLRAPDIYFKLTSLYNEFGTVSQFANVSSYLNTGGADDFFFVDLVDDPHELQRSSFVTIRNRDKGKEFKVETRFVKNFIESPTQVKKINTRKNNYDSYLITISREDDIKGTEIEDYIRWGENQGYNEASGRKNKEQWWVLGDRALINTELLWPNRQNDRHFIAYNPDKLVSHRFYRLEPKNSDIDPKLIAALLNFTATPLFIEVLASTGLGQGVLDVTGPTIRQVPMINPNILSEEKRSKLMDAFSNIGKRRMNSVFKEIGAENPEEVSLDKVKEDRRKLDKVIMEDILGLSKKEQLEVYRGVVQLVKNRIETAQSVKKQV